MRRGTALALALLLPGCVGEREAWHEGDGLDALLAFDKPSQCEVGPKLEHLLKTLLRDTTEEPVVVGPVEVPQEFAAQVGRPTVQRDGDEYTATVPLAGRWLGLSMDSVSVQGFKGGDGAGFFITVRAPSAALVAALNRAGFDAPLAGERHASPPDEGEWWGMSVKSEGLKSSLRCALHD